ncbi:MAG: beta-ketoacyl synthase N-terminal-like domain-containing protein [Candidatus Contendobacter sp.]|nr:beta-ketoacyl synthase N-terminal-like domain-containing protein [Candidatus Contendobacter sp.]MDG4558383.1 beta-ketoacyl synthase N-terminal-like domain-containing protein [Candidatus Contendobacter sp.]
MAVKKLKRGVALVGAGMTPFGTFPGLNTRDLFVQAFQEMRASVDKGFDPKDIEALVIGNYSSTMFEGQNFMAPYVADAVGLTPIPASRVECACASSGLALRQAIMTIGSGLADVVLVGGLEKESDLPIARVTDVLATASDSIYENPAGFTFPGLYALLATAYMHRYGATPETFMRIAIKNHENGVLNPKAQFGARIADIMVSKQKAAAKRGKPVPQWDSELDFLKDDQANPAIAWPMRLFDCSPVSDGAVSLLLVAEEIASSFTDKPLHIIGYGQGSDVPTYERESLTTIKAARIAAEQAYATAGVTPKDIKVCEVHDCFTIAELIAIEDLGFFKPGEGYKAIEEGLTSRLGPRPINSSGGLKSKGHPVGATGAGQVVEVFKQMRGEAGPRQVPGDLNLGLTHNLGGSGMAAIVHIFERRQ